MTAQQITLTLWHNTRPIESSYAIPDDDYIIASCVAQFAHEHKCSIVDVEFAIDEPGTIRDSVPDDIKQMINELEVK